MTENASANDYEASQVNVGRSAVRSLNAAVAHVEQSAVQRLAAETVTAGNSAIGVTNAATVELNESAAGFVVGDYVRAENSRVLVLLAPRVSGNVAAFITLPGMFAFGAGYFLARQLAKSVLGRSKS